MSEDAAISVFIRPLLPTGSAALAAQPFREE